ncbi:major facilitator superfamily domain-containing protein [Aspergillus pseudonomiae]|uniref:Major facilitator superfamily domain-containing protein n=1 Tax=Aspergillus pseudonomiae TaxID=1506151 RepID=A0A5N6ID32_9EURO|nr:major facilitator superfamily domain-containing protein [Aspergillus pseudonomiae]KAB8262943.1 major facilitator superfamily domain-containing protein [Aspergillus pseudonomiae]KAE8406212.1 major facilitator superfamily domain-containing protein [Aspergillus pseudonomiae]
MDRVAETSKEAEDSISPHAYHTMSEVTNLDKSGNQIVAEATSADDVEKQSDTQSLQAGVQRAEILRKGWTKKGLYMAFVGLFIATLAINFGDYSTQVYVPYTTSAFKQHSAMSAARVVMNITRIASYPVIAKLGDVFGRAEMFILAIAASTLGYVIYAACEDIAQYMVAGIFEAIGSTGYALTQQVFVADVTNLVNRGIWSTLPDSLTTVPTLYLGTIVAQRMLDHSTWRWGWGMWAIITPVCAVPLIGTMLVYQRRAPIKVPIAKAMGWKETDTWYQRAYRLLWVELDLPGGVLLLLGLALLLVPIALTGSNNSNAWHKGNFIAMLVLGVVFLISFVIWDARFAKKPFVPYRMIKQRTVAAACLLGALDFFHYSVFSVFFTSYLQVAGHFNAGNATRIDNSLRVAFQVSGIFAAFFMKYTKRSQIWVLIGVPLCILGMGILLYLVDMGDGQTGNEAAFVTAKSLIGIGRGFYQTAAQVSVQAVVSRQEVSVVTAVFFASMSIGGAIGTSVAGAIWRSNLPRKLSMYLPDEAKGQAKSIFGSIVVAQKYPVGEPVRIAIDRSYRESQRLLAIAAIAALAPMLVIMFFLKNVRLDERQTEKEEEREMVEQKKGDAE